MASVMNEGAAKTRGLIHDARRATQNEFYAVRNLPIFQNWMFDSAAAARRCTQGDVRLICDPQSGVIVNRDFRPEIMGYDAHYQNEQAVSAVFCEHLDRVAAIIDDHFQGCTLIEVGCGKGCFLERMQSRGFDITGLDPAYEGTNPAIVRHCFTPELELRSGGIILRHVLEHVQNPVDFLLKIRRANGGSGKVYIEVPCFDWICARRAWFDVFYEHVNYFRSSDFLRMFGQVHEAGHVFGGQYLYVVAELASLRRSPASEACDVEFPADFVASVARHARSLKSQQKTQSAIWGGASKGVIFALFMERAGAPVELVVDTNPAKRGKFLPGTGLEVRSPRDAARLLPPHSKIIVMNGNYLAEVKEATENRFHYTTADHEFI